MKKYFITAGIAFGIGAATAIAVMITLRPAPNPVIKPYIEPISGAPALLTDTTRHGDTVRYVIKYVDAGSSALNVPVDSIPEAFAWRHYNWTKTLLYSTDGTVIGLLGYRYERIIFHGGIFIRTPQIATRCHFKTSGEYDAGIVFGCSYMSESPLF